MSAMSSRKKRHLIPDFESRSVALIGACLLAPLAASAHGLQSSANASHAQARAGERRALVAYVERANAQRTAALTYVPKDPTGA
jgi:hypothetical protein